jgi:ACS family pantothenate transporter-like MFS transporter
VLTRRSPAIMGKLSSYFHSEKSSAAEKKLVRKLDFFILTFCCMMYFMNYLDRSNLAQAYVSGMKEDLGFLSNELTVINTVFSCGYIM